MSAHPLAKSRQIGGRWVIEGDLVLQTPTHLGNGDTDGIVDMPLLLDEATGRALLPGTSLAGALRNYLREYRHGFEQRATDALIEALFGGEKGNDEGNQSALIIDDALGEMPGIELRDGVRIDPITRTAKSTLMMAFCAATSTTFSSSKRAQPSLFAWNCCSVAAMISSR